MKFIQETYPNDVDTISLNKEMLILTQLFKEVLTVRFLDIVELLQILLYEMLRNKSTFSTYSFRKLLFFFLFSMFPVYSVLNSMASIETFCVSFP